MQANGQNQKKRALSWQPFLIGGLAFLLLTGGRIARPANLGWVMEGDPGMNLLGWMFFRDGPVLLGLSLDITRIALLLKGLTLKPVEDSADR
jgi:hypothetical protein